YASAARSEGRRTTYAADSATRMSSGIHWRSSPSRRATREAPRAAAPSSARVGQKCLCDTRGRIREGGVEDVESAVLRGVEGERTPWAHVCHGDDEAAVAAIPEKGDVDAVRCAMG